MSVRRVVSSSPSGCQREEFGGNPGHRKSDLQGGCLVVQTLQRASQPCQLWRRKSKIQVRLRLPGAHSLKLLLPMIFYSLAVVVFVVQVPSVCSSPVSTEKPSVSFHVRFFPLVHVHQRKEINQGNSIHTFSITQTKELDQEQTKTRTLTQEKIEETFPNTQTKNLKQAIVQQAPAITQSGEKSHGKIQQIIPVTQTRGGTQNTSHKEISIAKTRKTNQEKTQHAPPITRVSVLSFPPPATSTTTTTTSRVPPTSSVLLSSQTNNSWANKFSESLPGGHDVGDGGGGGGGGVGGSGSVRNGECGGSDDGGDAWNGCGRGWLGAGGSKRSTKFAHVISDSRSVFESFRSLEHLKNFKSQSRTLFASSQQRGDAENLPGNTDYKVLTTTSTQHRLSHHNLQRETVGPISGSGSHGGGDSLGVFPARTSGHLHTRWNKEMPTKRPTFSLRCSRKEETQPVTRLGSPTPKFHWHSVSNFRDLSNQVSSPGSFTSTPAFPSISSRLATSIFLLNSSTSLPTPFTSPLTPFPSFLSLYTSPTTPLTSSTSPLTSSSLSSTSTNTTRSSLRPVTLPASPASAQKENFHLLQALKRRRRRKKKTDLESIPERELIHIDNAAAARIDERADSNWESGGGDEIRRGRRRAGRKVVKREEKTVTDGLGSKKEEDKHGARPEEKVKVEGWKKMKKKRKAEEKRKEIEVRYGWPECKNEDAHGKGRGVKVVRRKVNKMNTDEKIVKRDDMKEKRKEERGMQEGKRMRREKIGMKMQENEHKEKNTVDIREKKEVNREGIILVKREGRTSMTRERHKGMKTKGKKFIQERDKVKMKGKQQILKTKAKKVKMKEGKKVMMMTEGMKVRMTGGKKIIKKEVKMTEGELVKTESEKVQSEGNEVKNSSVYQSHSPQLVSQLSEYKEEEAADATSHHHRHYSQLLSRHKRKKDVDEIQVVAGEVAVLPCDLAVHDPRDSVQLVLWIKEGVHTPLYSYDFREPLGPKETKPHSTSTLAARTSFKTDTTPATLVVERVVAEDAGVYRCRVDHLTSPTTNTRTSLTVIVPSRRVHITWSVGQDSPMAAENLVLGPFKEGESPVINCTSQDGWPAPSVVWYEDDEVLDDTYNVVPPDAGVSTSRPVAAASTGSIGTSMDPSGTSKGLGGTIVDPGGIAVGPARANAGPPNTAVVVNTLSLGTLTRADLHRRITCLAVNLNTTQPASETVTIDMTLGVVSVEVVVSGEVWAGEEREVECRVYGCRPQPLVVWWLEADMMDTTRYKRVEGGNVTVAVLSLVPRREDDGALLICQATNVKLPQLAFQDSRILDVSYAPVVEIRLGRSLDPARIKEGDDVYFECSVTAKPPVIAVTWSHNGVELEGGSGVFVSNMSLVVQGVTRARGGTYTCTATNVRAAVSSAPLTLDVKYAPVCGEEQGRTQYSVAKKENAEVSCRVDANPANVTFRWTFNNTAEAIDVPDGRFMVVGTESRVNYTPMTDLDYGTLLCWANNSVGTQSHPCIFHILPAGKPDPPHHCRVLDVALTSLQVSCLPGNDGGLDQRFLLQMYPVGSGQPVVEVRKMDPSFTVTRLQPATAYRVAVAALNHRGVSRPTQLQVVTGSLLSQPRGTSAEPTREREGGGAGGPKLGVGVAVGVAVAVLVVVVAVVIITFPAVRRRFQPSTPSPRTTTPLSPDVPTTLSLASFCSPHHDLDLLSYAPDPGGGSIHISTVSVSASLQMDQQPTFTHTAPVPASPAVLLDTFPPWTDEPSSRQPQPDVDASQQILSVHVLNPT